MHKKSSNSSNHHTVLMNFPLSLIILNEVMINKCMDEELYTQYKQSTSIKWIQVDKFQLASYVMNMWILNLFLLFQNLLEISNMAEGCYCTEVDN